MAGQQQDLSKGAAVEEVEATMEEEGRGFGHEGGEEKGSSLGCWISFFLGFYKGKGSFSSLVGS